MASTVRSAAGRTIESVGSRSLFVKVNPIPTTLSQRRAVLKAMQRYGEIEVFKKLANEASFVSVAATSDVARKLVERSPINFHFVAEPFDGLSPSTSLLGSGRAGLAPPIHPVEISKSASGEKNHPNETTRFTVHLFPNESYKHKTNIRYSPLHGPWPHEQGSKETFVHAALKKTVPKDMMASDAFCDWRTGGQLSDDARIMRNQAQNGKLAHIQQRMMRRRKKTSGSADGRSIILTELTSLRQPKADTAAAADKNGDE